MTGGDRREPTVPQEIPSDLREAIYRGAEQAFNTVNTDVTVSERGDILAEALLEVDVGASPAAEPLEQAVRSEVERILASRGTLPGDVIAAIHRWTNPETAEMVTRHAERSAPRAIPSIRAFTRVKFQVRMIRITDDAIEYELQPPARVFPDEVDSTWKWYDIHSQGSTQSDHETELSISTFTEPVRVNASIKDSRIIRSGPGLLSEASTEHGESKDKVTNRTETALAKLEDWTGRVLTAVDGVDDSSEPS